MPALTHWLWTVPPDALAAFVRTETFALRHQGRSALRRLRPGDRVFVYVSGSQALAASVEVAGEPFEDSTTLVVGRHLPHRVRVRPLTVLPRTSWVPAEGFVPHLSVPQQYPGATVSHRFRRVAQRVLHEIPAVDGKVLDFLLATRRGDDPEALMEAVEAVRQAREHAPAPEPPRVGEAGELYRAEGFDRAAATVSVLAAIEARGFLYEPWQVATFLTALRTKPFVLLAGVTGVGKSRLPQLVADATGGTATVLPVRPDWADPSDTLGYVGLDGRFRPGALLREARSAMDHPERYRILVLDEMNLARPEHYLAEVLSAVERRIPSPHGPESPPLVSERLNAEDAVWQSVRWPGALSLVGTVNIDESTHTFSRKVLDRAFAIELGTGDLLHWEHASVPDSYEDHRPWPMAAWWPRATRLAELSLLSTEERSRGDETLRVLRDVHEVLAPADLGFGFRTRDEVALFVLHARETPEAFRTRHGDAVDPLDVALLTKVLPRIDAVGEAADTAVYRLLVRLWMGRSSGSEHEALALLHDWRDAGRPDRLEEASFPLSAARVARLVERMQDDGVVSFWS